MKLTWTYFFTFFTVFLLSSYTACSLDDKNDLGHLFIFLACFFFIPTISFGGKLMYFAFLEEN
jgi:hypothetical protein